MQLKIKLEYIIGFVFTNGTKRFHRYSNEYGVEIGWNIFPRHFGFLFYISHPNYFWVNAMNWNYLVNVSVEVTAETKELAEEIVCMKLAPPSAIEKELAEGIKAVWVGGTKHLVRK